MTPYTRNPKAEAEYIREYLRQVPYGSPRDIVGLRIYERVVEERVIE